MHTNDLSPLQEELIGLLQEEAAEIIQELSKLRRTGTRFCRNGRDVPTIDYVNQEITDFNMLLEIGTLIGLFNNLSYEKSDYRIEKKERLKQWTNIPHSLIESI